MDYILTALPFKLPTEIYIPVITPKCLQRELTHAERSGRNSSCFLFQMVLYEDPRSHLIDYQLTFPQIRKGLWEPHTHSLIVCWLHLLLRSVLLAASFSPDKRKTMGWFTQEICPRAAKNPIPCIPSCSPSSCPALPPNLQHSLLKGSTISRCHFLLLLLLPLLWPGLFLVFNTIKICFFP